jgi:hypothetical protein
LQQFPVNLRIQHEAKAMRFHFQRELLPGWLQWLQLINFKEERRIVHGSRGIPDSTAPQVGDAFEEGL